MFQTAFPVKSLHAMRASTSVHISTERFINMFDIWRQPSALAEEQYAKQNYKIVQNENGGATA